MGGTNVLQNEVVVDIGQFTAGMEGASAVAKAALEKTGVAFETLSLQASEATTVISEKMGAMAESAEVSAAGIGSAFGALGAILGGGIIVGALATMMDKVEETAIHLEHMSTATGTSVQDLSALGYAAKQASVPFEQIQMGLTRLSRAMDAASQGSKQQSVAFARLGIDTEGWAQHLPPAIEVMMKMADSLDGATDKGRATAIVMALMGRGAQGMVPFLMQGSKAIHDQMIEAHTLGAVMSDETVKASQQLHTETVKLGAVWQGMLQNTMPGLLEAFKYLTVGAIATRAGFEELGIAALTVSTILSNAAVTAANISFDILRGNLKQAAADATNSAAEMKYQFSNAATQITDVMNKAAQDIGAVWDKVAEHKTANEHEFADAAGNSKDALRAQAEEQRILNAQLDVMIHGLEVGNDKRKADNDLTLQLSNDLIIIDESLSRIQQKDISKGIKEAINESQRLADLTLSNALHVAQEQMRIESDTDAFKVRIGAETDNQMVANKLKQINAEQNAEVAALVARQKVYGTTLVEFTKLQNEITLVNMKAEQERQKLAQHSLEVTKAKWDQYFNTISRAFDTSIQGMIMGTQTFKQAMGNIGQAIMGEFVSMLVQRATKWIENEIFMAVFGRATAAATSAGDIANSAAVGSAAAFASISAIPIIGPEMAPAVAAETFSSIMAMEGLLAFAKGGIVPDDAMAMVHRGEMVLPKAESQVIQSVAASGGGGHGPNLAPHLRANTAAMERVARTNDSILSELGSLNRMLRLRTS